MARPTKRTKFLSTEAMHDKNDASEDEESDLDFSDHYEGSFIDSNENQSGNDNSSTENSSTSGYDTDDTNDLLSNKDENENDQHTDGIFEEQTITPQPTTGEKRRFFVLFFRLFVEHNS